jgi:hypothetical protein
MQLELQICDHRAWDVNNQCPRLHVNRTQFSSDPLPPVQLINELSAPGRLVRTDLYLSTTRAYIFLAGAPYACANLSKAPAAGPVTVTFGDVLYHSGVDEPVVGNQSVGYDFIKNHQKTETRRHFDHLEFKSGLPAPAWNEAVLPCTSAVDP